MKLIANYHTHNKLCGHASGDSFDYVKEAIKYGYKYIGLSDHGYVPRLFMSEEDYKFNWLDEQMDEDKFFNIYLKELDAVIEKYGKDIVIYRSTEVEYIHNHDYYYENLLKYVDYLNLGVHFFDGENGVMYNTYEHIKDENVLSHYVRAAVDGMNTGYFKALVHPDLFMYNYKDETHPFDEACEKASREIIECAIKNKMYLELNCGGIRKGTFTVNGVTEYFYPRTEFWKIVKEYKDALVIIGMDAHNPADLVDQRIIDIAVKFLNDLGIPFHMTMNNVEKRIK